ncbi:LLM class flavin-dependent oxidoreductase [Flavobacterium sp. '19STA2R22 D10 B1']|uniref:LLM class flavin-dependent oxidoreductase n=1 Tax=Flavobacterium aerium TaxID=3037261 RepID=UPI00278BEF8A|nr:LLM class flavin-dependent oxidoreductase [Flavobacterium sp. '19STA2R22 D10 B1']
MTKIPLSVLELATVTQGGNHATAMQNTVEVAQHAESLGYKRIWMAEHHNMEHIASSATSVLIGHVAGKTNTIRVGSGGIMLPNHSPLVIAEQFGTLENLYPNRIDLGLGRAPGTDQLTAMALRRNSMDSSYNFPTDVKQLQTYFSSDNCNSKVRAFPGEGLDIPLWILGSSTDSAYLAAQMGLPYAFAAHFAPAQFRTAIDIYRKNFQPSQQLQQPYVMACVNVIAADTDQEASLLLTSLLRLFLGIITNTRSPLQPPGELPSTYNIPEVKSAVNGMLSCTFTGSKETLRTNLSEFIEETGIDELMVASYIFDRETKLKSFTILQDALSTV